jgi:hypothetical protein
MAIELDLLLEEVRALELPVGEYVLAGSVPMGLAELRAVNDIDVIVSDSLWEELIHRYAFEYNSVGALCIRIGHIEILNSWYGHKGNVSELIAQAQTVRELPVMPLEWVRQWKRFSGRPKDLADLEIIDAYLASPRPRDTRSSIRPPEGYA